MTLGFKGLINGPWLQTTRNIQAH